MSESIGDTRDKSDTFGEDSESLRIWIEQFSDHVKNLEFRSAASMMSPTITSFSTWSNAVNGVEDFVDSQWREVWPTIDDFRFASEDMRIEVSPDRLMALVAVTWTSTGYYRDQRTFDRPGRATFVLKRKLIDEPWIGAHGHFSLNRGTPQVSYGTRSTNYDSHK